MTEFLHGCDLPQAWSGQPQWRILETGFADGRNFLATLHAWKQDPQRPRLLHYVAIDAKPAPAADATQGFGLQPELNRLPFEGGHVLLTLHVGDVRDVLRREPFVVDSVFLGGFDPDLHVLKAMARHCRRGTRIATGTSVGDAGPDLAQCGFVNGVFDPAWEPKGPRVREPITPSHCVVVGAGLAGAAVAASLAHRGWTVTVLDAAALPASGASGLPVGMLAPHHSSDDNLLSRLTRHGVRATFEQAKRLLREGEDWRMTGVLEMRDGIEVQHEHAGWLKPAALVRAWLGHEAIAFRGNALVARIVRDGDWAMLDAAGNELARAPLVIVAAAHASSAVLANDLPLQPVRGQVSWGLEQGHGPMPEAPVKGNGHFIPHVPTDDGLAWFCGSTYDRGDTGVETRAADHLANRERLRELLPDVAHQLAPAFESGAVNAWTGVRCASSNRRPLVGEIEPGLWVSTAMGSRGLTFAFLCAELLAAKLHAEPPPLERKLAESISPSLMFQY